MNMLNRSSIRVRTIQLVLISVLPFFALICLNAIEQRRSAVRAAEEESFRLAKIAAASQQQLIASTEHLLLALSRLPEVRRREPNACGELFRRLLRAYPFYANMAATNASGDVFCSALPFNAPINLSDRSYFKRAMQAKRFAVGEYQIGRITGKATVNFAYPLFDKLGRVDGVFTIALALSHFTPINLLVNLPKSMTLTVYDRRGTVLAHHPNDGQMTGRTAFESESVRAKFLDGEGIKEAVGDDGKRWLYGVTGFGESGEKGSIYIAIGVPATVAMADANKALTRNAMTLGMITALALLAAWFGSDRFIRRPLDALIRMTQSIGAGHLGVRSALPHYDNEIGRLASGLDRMAQSLDERESALRLAGARLQDSFDRTKALHEMEMALASTLDLDQLMNLLLEKIDLVLPGAVTTVRLFNRTNGTLEPVACRNIDERAWRASRTHLVHGFPKIVLENRVPVAIKNIQTDARNDGRSFALQFGLVSYLGVPLIAKNEVIGIIGYFTKTEHAFGEEEVAFLTAMASQTANAIANAKLYANARRGAEETSALHSLTAAITRSLDTDMLLKEAANKIAESFHFDATRIYLYNAEKDEIHLDTAYELEPDRWTHAGNLQPGRGLVRRVVETGESLVFDDIRSDPRYPVLSHSKYSLAEGAGFLALLPIASKLSMRGILVCTGNMPRTLDADEKRLLASMCDQVAVAMENASLYRQTDAKAKELSALYRIAAVASQTLDIDEFFRQTMEIVLELFRFHAARIYLRHGNSSDAYLIAHKGMPMDSALFSAYSLGDGPLDRVLDAGEVIYVADMRKEVPTNSDHDGYRNILVDAGFRGSLAIPIVSKGQALGVMHCLSRDPHDFTEAEKQLIQTLAHHLGLFVGNAHLYSTQKAKAIELENANKAKDNFLSVMSHELRTPLNVIDGYAQLLNDQVLGGINPAQEHAVGKILRQSAELLSTINGILQVRRVEANAIHVDFAPTNLCRLLNQLKSKFSVYHSHDQALAIRWDYPCDLPSMVTDSDKLKYVLENLIGNALKFTHHGEVTISARYVYETDAIRFTVADTGIGIAKESLPIIFEQFRQVDSSDTRHYGGVGVGLYLARAFINALAGNISVDSNVGIGTTFTVTIPRDPHRSPGYSGSSPNDKIGQPSID